MLVHKKFWGIYMLKYLFMVTESTVILGIITGVLFAFMKVFYEKKGKLAMFIGCAAGLIAAAVMSYIKNHTKRFDMNGWNLRTLIVLFIIFGLFIIMTIGPIRKLTRKPGEYIASVLGASFIGYLWFYELPDVIAYPSNFDLSNNSVFSTDFLYRFIGYLLGLLLIFVSCMIMYRIMVRLPKLHNAIFMRVASCLIVISFLGNFFNILLSKRMIKMNSPMRKPVFEITKNLQNNSNWFIYAAIALAVAAAAILFFRNIRVTQEYSNPAQHRKIRAGMRSSRRYAVVMAVCAAISVLNLTVVYAIDNQAVVLSPVEDCEIRNDSLYISFEQVEDGHLHRFAYKTNNNRNVRFIVIKKPNSKAYGVGLDACDICGETGYYERNGQIVCKLCDVVMNINTIGFKGGCNPIVIDYKIEDGYIIVPISTLVEHEKKFKS